RQHVELQHLRHRPLTGRIEETQRLDLVSEELGADGRRPRRREDVDDSTAETPLPDSYDSLNAPVSAPVDHLDHVFTRPHVPVAAGWAGARAREPGAGQGGAHRAGGAASRRGGGRLEEGENNRVLARPPARRGAPAKSRIPPGETRGPAPVEARHRRRSSRTRSRGNSRGPAPPDAAPPDRAPA